VREQDDGCLPTVSRAHQTDGRLSP
jgi:hypothetical protein